eukprot:5812901-Amphidinium_carterae.4
MTPQNDTFKAFRCKAIVGAFDGAEDWRFTESLISEGQEPQEHVITEDGMPPRGANAMMVQSDDILRAMQIIRRAQSQPQGSADQLLAVEVCQATKRYLGKSQNQAAWSKRTGRDLYAMWRGKTHSSRRRR